MKTKKLLTRCRRLNSLIVRSTQDQELAWLTYILLYADWNFKEHWFKAKDWTERDDVLKFANKCLLDIRADKLIRTYELSRYQHQITMYRLLNGYYTIPVITKLYQIISNFKHKLCSH